MQFPSNNGMQATGMKPPAPDAGRSVAKWSTVRVEGHFAACDPKPALPELCRRG